MGEGRYTETDRRRCNGEEVDEEERNKLNKRITDEEKEGGERTRKRERTESVGAMKIKRGGGKEGKAEEAGGEIASAGTDDRQVAKRVKGRREGWSRGFRLLRRVRIG